MMTFEQWKEGTERGFFTPRSSALKAIDGAFEKWQNNKNTPNLLDFSKSVKTWITLKGDKWTTSTRNSNGTVERLVADLAANPIVGRDFAPLLNVKPADNTVGIAKVISQKDADGSWHKVFLQSEENSCGAACIRNVANIVHNEDIGEAGLRAVIEAAEEGAGYAGSLGQGGVVASSGVHDWGPGGGGTWLVPEGLKALRPAISTVHTTLAAALLTTTRKQPAIAVVEWVGGGLHYVIVAGPLQKVSNAYLVIDPWYGVQKVDVVGGQLAQYEPVDEFDHLKDTANWYPWVCKVV
jgi:hypothetical protein